MERISKYALEPVIASVRQTLLSVTMRVIARSVATKQSGSQGTKRLTACFLSFFVFALLVAQVSLAEIQAPKNTAKIFGADDRTYVSDTSVFPYSAIGTVEIIASGQARLGTGVLIGKKTVLTNGHGVAPPGSTINIQATYFSPGKNGSSLPLGHLSVASIKVKEEWADDKNDEYDFALMFLDHEVGDTTSYFKIAVEPDSFFVKRSLTSVGYPYDLGEIYPYSITGQSQGMDGNLILNTLDSEPGQSGSPLWFDDNGELRLVGLLKGIRETTELNGSITSIGLGVRIDANVARWIKKEMAAAGDVEPQIINEAPANPIGCGIAPLLLILMGITLGFTAMRE